MMLVLALGLVLCPLSVPAAPVLERAFLIRQPDDGLIRAVRRGDEWRSWTETLGGYAIARDTEGVWCYVEEFAADGSPILSPNRADRAPPRRASRHLRPPPRAAARIADPRMAELAAPFGSFSGPVLFILAEFTDRAGITDEASWGSLIVGDIADYYAQASHGQVSLAAAREDFGIRDNGVVGWVNLGYQHPNTSTAPANRRLAADAILAADPYVDFAFYDTNSDGHVDSRELAVVIIAAGYDRAYNAGYSPAVWAHSWWISTLGAPTVDGVLVGDSHSGAGGYAQFGELHRGSDNDQHQATVGVMVHELGHLIFALPDLYDTDGSSAGIGPFGLMGSGSWGQAMVDTYAGERPVLPSAWSRSTLGWADCVDGSGTELITAAAAAAATRDNACFRAGPAGHEYFLIENRQPIGYDQGLERDLGAFSGGVAIWHVDDSQAGNADDSHRLVDLEEADTTELSGARDLWFSGNNPVFDADSNPGSDFYSGEMSGVTLDGFGPSDTLMEVTFEAVASAEILTPVPGSTLAGGAVEFHWTQVSEALRYRLDVGSDLGSSDYDSLVLGAATLTTTVSGLPVDGSMIYLRLWTDYGEDRAAAYRDYQYLASSSNQPPTAGGQSLSTLEDVAVDIRLDTAEPHSGTLTYRVVAAPGFGVLSGQAPDLRYQPRADYFGPDSFDFVVSDGMQTSAPATVSISVVSVNDPPVAEDQSLSTGADQALAVDLRGRDPDGDDLTYRILMQPRNGTLSGTAPNLTYRPHARFSGSDILTFNVSDGDLTSSPGTVRIDIEDSGSVALVECELQTTAAAAPTGDLELSNIRVFDGTDVVQLNLGGSEPSAETWPIRYLSTNGGSAPNGCR